MARAAASPLSWSVFRNTGEVIRWARNRIVNSVPVTMCTHASHRRAPGSVRICIRYPVAIIGTARITMRPPDARARGE
jgi:hypothetical protein